MKNSTQARVSTISNLRDKHPRRKKGDRDRTISITKTLVLGTKMKSQKDKEVKVAFKSKKNRTKKQGGKADRLRVSLVQLFVKVHIEKVEFLKSA